MRGFTARDVFLHRSIAQIHSNPTRCPMACFSRYSVAVILCVSILMLGSLPTFAQAPDPTRTRFETRLLAGASLGGSFNSYTRGIPMVYTPICNRLEAGSGFGYNGGLVLEYLLSPALSLTMRARYGNYPASFNRVEPIGKTTITEDGAEGYVVVDIASQIHYEALEADCMLKWGGAISSGRRVRAGVAVGASATYPIEATMSQEHILKFYDLNGEVLTQRSLEEQSGEELRRRTLADGEDMPRMKWQRYGLRTGLFLDYELGAGVYMTPGLYADFPLTTFTDFQWGSLGLYQLQIDLTVGI